MSGPDPTTTVLAVPTPQQDEAVSEKKGLSTDDDAVKASGKDGGSLSPEIKEATPPFDHASSQDKDTDDEGHIIITGADAAAHLLPMRDDGDPALTFRSLFLATILACFQAVMYQIYLVIYSLSRHGRCSRDRRVC
jgi:hypothetical protein